MKKAVSQTARNKHYGSLTLCSRDVRVLRLCVCMCARRGGREGHMTGWHATVYRALIRRVS